MIRPLLFLWLVLGTAFAGFGTFGSRAPASGGGGGEEWTKITASMLTAYQDTNGFVLSGPTGGTSGIAAEVRNTGGAVNYALVNTACYEIDTTAAGLDGFDVDARGGIEFAFDFHELEGAEGLGIAGGIMEKGSTAALTGGISRNTGNPGVFEVQTNFWNGGALGAGTSTATEGDYSQFAYSLIRWETEFSASNGATQVTALWGDATGTASGLYDEQEINDSYTNSVVPVLCYTQRTNTDQGAGETIDVSVWVRDYDATDPS